MHDALRGLKQPPPTKRPAGPQETAVTVGYVAAAGPLG